MKKQILGK